MSQQQQQQRSSTNSSWEQTQTAAVENLPVAQPVVWENHRARPDLEAPPPPPTETDALLPPNEQHPPPAARTRDSAANCKPNQHQSLNYHHPQEQQTPGLAAPPPTGTNNALLVDYLQEEQSYTNGEKKTTTTTTGDLAAPMQQPKRSSSYRVTNGRTRQYWGRFDDPRVTATTYDSARDDDGVEQAAVATARPDDRAIRMAFIRRVYGILSGQLLLTFAVCACFALYQPTRQFVLYHANGLLWCSTILCFGTLLPLNFYRRSYPTNYCLLATFTVSMATMVGLVTALYAEAGAGDLVLEAVAITASVFIVLTIYTLQSKWDFSFLGAGLGMCLWIMILWGFFGIIFGLKTGSVYALLGSILFSGFIIYDTYMIAERLDPEDYVVAAIELYLDLVNLFLYILQLLSASNR